MLGNQLVGFGLVVLWGDYFFGEMGIGKREVVD